MDNDKYRCKELGDFLKIKRAKILPSQVGITQVAHRRTPGLKREEVALSISWYTWLEQGRPIQVSTQVIESLSRVLLINKQERSHLYFLANLPVSADIPQDQEIISSMLQHVLDSLIFSPSLVMDQRWNVIAWNKAACLIFGDFNKMNVRERNIVWEMFTNRKYKKLFVDWDYHAKNLIGKFRLTYGQYIKDSWFIQFIDELKMQSEEFDLLWSLHEVQSKSETYKQLNHPTVGRLDFGVIKFDVSDNPGLTLIVHTPLGDTDRKMKLLIEDAKIAVDNVNY